MSKARGWLTPAAWKAADERWYSDLVANCLGLEDTTADMPDVLERLNQRDVEDCLFMSGADLDGRYLDVDENLWSDDAKRRWSAKIDGKKVFLHHRIAELQPNRVRANGDLVSHFCGQVNCIRLEHIGYQSSGEDIRDRRHHHKRKRGEIRPDCAAYAVRGV